MTPSEESDPIPYARQSISEEDIAAVVAVLRSDWLTQGPLIEQFENAVARACGARFAVAVSSGTAGLHLACLAAGLGPGQTLWTSAMTFVASANCGRYCGAAVDLVDIDPRTYNLSLAELTAKFRQAERAPRVLVPVHFAGQSCQMAPIAALARQHGTVVIEDASHALGGRYRNEPVGCGRYSDMTVLSFHPVKIITTGEGGMILTNREDLRERLLRLRTHGITRDPAWMRGPSEGPWYYQMLELGYNYRITDLQAALGLSQLARLETFVTRRRELARRYHQLLSDLPLTLPFQDPDTDSSWHLYVVRIQRDRARLSHRELFEELRRAGVGVNLHYIPVHQQPYYRELGFKPGQFKAAEDYYQEALSLPMFYGLTDDQQDRVAQTLRKLL